MPIALLVAALGQAAAPLVDPLFSDNMVLQRDRPDPIWGWTDPGAKITVSIGGKSVDAVADAKGAWLAMLPKFGAGGSYVLQIDGPRDATITNVTFGDVWICSGQSNMEFGVGNLANPTSELGAADYPDIRLGRIPKRIAAQPVPYVQSDWQVCNANSLLHDGDWNGFSAVAYFFGKQLYDDLKVPIGLLHTSWGGTICEAWASAPSLERHQPEFTSAIQEMVRNANDPTPLAERLEAWYAKNDAGQMANPAWSDPSVSDADWLTVKVPGYFQDAGIPSLVNHASVVWYRKTVDLPTDTDFTGATIDFGADDNDVTWINGAKVGATDGVQVRRGYKIPAGVLHSGSNTVVVRVTDTFAPGGIFDDKQGQYIEIPNRPRIDLAGEWKVKLGVAITNKNPLPAALADNPNQPTVLYNGMVSPLGPFAVKGAIWYQGESNVGRAKQYATLLPTMIGSWRDQFRSGDFPFLIVQLAGYMHAPAQPGDDAWADLREAQMIASRTCPNAGIATAFDIGNPDDIHPKNKEEVGRRLALVAEAKTYHRRIEYAGPTYTGFSVQGGTIRVRFDHAEGLKTADGQTPRGFAIAGADHKWHWADAKIDGSTVVVSSPDVPSPTAVRYAWANYLDVNLQNSAGLPTFPFRTDR